MYVYVYVYLYIYIYIYIIYIYMYTCKTIMYTHIISMSLSVSLCMFHYWPLSLLLQETVRCFGIFDSMLGGSRPCEFWEGSDSRGSVYKAMLSSIQLYHAKLQAAYTQLVSRSYEISVLSLLC